MKATYVVCFVFIMVFLAGCVRPEEKMMVRHRAISGCQHCHTFEKTITKTVSSQYLLFLPEDYGEKQQWPLILFLHGAGERGNDLDKVKVHGPSKIVEKKKDFPFIVVSPQCPEGDWWPKRNEVLINLLDEIVSRYKVDTERIYLTGLSMGGYGTWSLVCEYPERFAAIAPICGGGEPFFADRLKDVPVWAFHGAKDDVVPVRESEEMVSEVKAIGGDARLTVYADAGHDSWTQTYNNQEIYDWFLKHRKNKKRK